MKLNEVFEKMFKKGKRHYFKRKNGEWMFPEEVNLGNRIFTYCKEGDPNQEITRVYEANIDDIVADDWELGPNILNIYIGDMN